MGKAAPALESFNAGELSPDTAARVTNEKYPIGCSTLQNMIPMIQGPAKRRPGSRFVTAVKNSANRTLLRKFIFSEGEAYQIEFGDGYCRFYTNHGQLTNGTPPAWNSSSLYGIGSLVSRSGTIYYCTTLNSNQDPAATTGFWYVQPGNIYEIPSPFGQALLFNADNTPGLQIEQSADVLYIATPGYWPQTLTRFSPNEWVFAAYAPPDGPFLPENFASSPAMWVEPIAGSPNQVTCFSTAPVFDPSDVAGSTPGYPGRLVRIDAQYFNIKPWYQTRGVLKGDLARFNGNTYQALADGTCGPTPPTQTNGIQWDGSGTTGVQWLYVDSGYGIGQVTAYTSAKQVTLTLSPYAGPRGQTSGNQFYKFPAYLTGIITTVSAITAANPAVVTVVGTAPNVGDPVYLTGIGGMTQISEQSYVATAVSGQDVTLGTVDASGYSAFTSGGRMITNASLNWSLGAWGNPAAQTPGSYPAATSFYGDRLFWGGGINWWGSAPGAYNSHAEDLYSQVTADCAVSGLISSQEVDSILWMQALNILLIGTNGGEFGLEPITSTQPLGPGNTAVVRQSKFRSRAIRGQIINTSNFYVQKSGKKVMAQDYNFYLDRYDSTNQNRLANHIAGYSVTSGIIDTDWHAEPYECLWGLRADGLLIGYTFDRQDNVTGWHEHVLGASAAGAAMVESISVIPAPDGTRDELWLVVNRTIAGQVVRSVEYLDKDFETGDAQNSMPYVDMSGTYNGSPTTTISGLSWLNGETVQILRDGGGHPNRVVSGGVITLDAAGSVVRVGLACPSNLVTMDIEGGADVGTAQGKIRRPNSVVVRLKDTLGGVISVLGKNPQLLLPNQTTTALGSPPPLFTGDTDRIPLDNDSLPTCKIQIQQLQPFQMEVLGIFPAITVEEPSPG